MLTLKNVYAVQYMRIERYHKNVLFTERNAEGLEEEGPKEAMIDSSTWTSVDRFVFMSKASNRGIYIFCKTYKSKTKYMTDRLAMDMQRSIGLIQKWTSSETF